MIFKLKLLFYTFIKILLNIFYLSIDDKFLCVEQNDYITVTILTKLIKAMNNIIHDIIKKRYSPVIFSSQKIENEKLVSLFEAARWAPSSYNEQPWRFIVGIKNQDESYAKLFDCLVEANQYWAKFAPVLVMSLAKRTSTVTGKPNRFAQHDTGMAVGNLLAQATSLGLYVHQMGGYSITKAKEHFDLNDDLEPMAIMAIGYKGEIELFPDDLQDREKKERLRKGLDEILF